MAVEQDGADVLVLGCMSMAFLPDITTNGRTVGVPIVNPVLPRSRRRKPWASMRLTHSKRAWPPPSLEEIACGPRGQARPSQV